MRGSIFIVLLSIVSLSAFGGRVELSDAIENGAISLQAVNFAGKYIGKTTRLTLTNTTKQIISVTIDAGVILKPVMVEDQPMVLAGGEMVTISAGRSAEVEVQTFCGNLSAHCPTKAGMYSFQKKGSDTLVRVLQFIQAHKLYDGLGQSGVWVVTNNAPIDDVYDSENKPLSASFVEHLCKVTGRPKPEMQRQVRYAEEAGATLGTPKALKIYAEFEVLLESPKTLTLGVFNDKGEMIQKVFEDQQFGKAGHVFGVDFEAADVASGSYYIRLKEGDVVMKEKVVRID
jgi:hypothetical protein